MDWQRRLSAWARANQRSLVGVRVIVLGVAGTLAARFMPIEGSEVHADWLAYALVWLAAGSLWWWRSKPLPALALCTVAVTAYWIRDYVGTVDVALWAAFFAATRHGGHDRNRVWRYVGAALAVILGVAVIGVIVPSEDLPLVAIIGIAFIHGTAAATGEALYQRSQHVAQLEQRAAALEGEIEHQAQLAAVEERTRIAREMHDIIAHGMSSVVVQSLAAQSVVESDPAKTREVLQTIEAIGRDSVDEMRRMLGVLRADTGELALEPQPDLDDLDELVEQARAAGAEVAIEVAGERRTLPPGLALTGYRIVQESLTNVVRHAGRPVAVVVDLVYHDDALEITVTDDGLGAAANPASKGTGHGLLGMAERVEIYNGSILAAPLPGGGFRVNASLPLATKVIA